MSTILISDGPAGAVRPPHRKESPMRPFHAARAARAARPPPRKQPPLRPFPPARAACAAIMALSLMAACGRQDAPDAAQPGTDAADPGEVNLYTPREPGLIQPLLDAFTASSGI